MTKAPKATIERFPAPVYAETVLMVNFEDAKKYFLEALLEIHSAHTLMLARQGIIPISDAKSCLNAVGAMDRQAITCSVYDSSCEDLFFYIEEQLGKCCGAQRRAMRVISPGNILMLSFQPASSGSGARDGQAPPAQAPCCK